MSHLRATILGQPLPVQVVLGQCAAAGLAGLAALASGPAAALSVVAGAVTCVLPGALIAQWYWQRGVRGRAAAIAQPVVKLLVAGGLLAGVLGGVVGVRPLAALAGFVIAVVAQPVVLVWASTRE